MQFILVNNKEMLVFPHAEVHNGVVCLVVRGFIHMCTGSFRSCGVSAAVIWSCTLGECCGGFGFFFFSGCSQFWCFSNFCASLPLLPPFFPLLSQCDKCPDVPMWGLMAGLQGLLAMGTFYCLGAG